MVEVRIPPPEARRVAAALRQCATHLSQIQSDLEKHLGDLRNRWRGDAEAAYAAGFAKRVKRLDERVRLLRDIARALERIAEAGEEADRDGKAVAPGG
jgi:WXG100 family type VII secretion target